MIESVKRNEVDVLLLCRLDRWFRSVTDYYSVMEILRKHSCEWLTTDEDYDTTTANGRLYINVKLSIAQNEADIDSERISVVFDSKINHGTVISGSCPFGYRINENKKLEIVPEQVAIIQECFDHFINTVSQRATIKYIREKYGVSWCSKTFTSILKNKIYTGEYDRRGRHNGNFCAPIIDVNTFADAQYLLSKEISRVEKDWEIKAKLQKKTVSSTNKATISRKLSKLKELYVNDLISLDDYKKDYEIYTAALKEISEIKIEKKPDLTKAREILTADFKNTYDYLTREEKRSLWRSVISEIHIDNNKNITKILFA